MPSFHKLRVREVRRETDDCVSVSFAVPEELKDAYAFTHGQYLTFKLNVDGKQVRRSYSICSSPLENDLRVAVKMVKGGAFSTFANETLKAGDELEVMTPMGRFFTELSPDHQKNYVAFAAGSGITPVMSIMKTVLQTEPQSSFTLVYGNKNTASIIFKEEIDGLKNKYMNRLRVFHVLSREESEVDILHGRIDNERCQELLKCFIDAKAIDEAFLCGPAPMIEAVRSELESAGVEKQKIHFELFASPQQLAQKSPAQAEDKPQVKGFESSVKIVLDGTAMEFTVDSEGENILDAALRNGADLPYACKGGVCATCRARLEEGEVRMDLNYSLEPDELERGFILTCQSHPKTKKVTVNFDVA